MTRLTKSLWSNTLLSLSLALAFVLGPGARPGRSQDVPPAILNLDLCTLAYQLYHQSLCLPLDPWYDVNAKAFSHRRENICIYSHQFAAKQLGQLGKGYYSGPSEARGWKGGNQELDPVLTNYKQVNPRLPSFTRDGSRFLAIQAPAYLTDNIKLVEGVRYKNKPVAQTRNTANVEKFNIQTYSDKGTDCLVVFEGGTGHVVDPKGGLKDPSWSLMGFVLGRKTAKGYDAHIVFRGSRSGAALLRTIKQATPVLDIYGNPDWVTDLGLLTKVTDKLISRDGKVTVGFSRAIETMLDPIHEACKAVDMFFGGPPQNIFVSGHSLGAALACQYGSSVLLGDYGLTNMKPMPNWPWQKNLSVISYAQPSPGDSDWVKAFDKKSPFSKHFYVFPDIVVTPGNQCGIQHKMSRQDGVGDNAHEPYVIRGEILRDKTVTPALVKNDPAILNGEKWAGYETIMDMITAAKPMTHRYNNTPSIVTNDNLRDVLNSYRFKEMYEGWLQEVYLKMIDDTKSYRLNPSAEVRKKRKDILTQTLTQMNLRITQLNDKKLTTAQRDMILKTLDNDIPLGKLGNEGEEKFIGLVMILATYQKTNVTLNQLLDPARKNIVACLKFKG